MRLVQFDRAKVDAFARASCIDPVIMAWLLLAASLVSIVHGAAELELAAESQDAGSWAEPLAGLVVVLAGAITSIVLLALCAGKKERPKQHLQSVAIQVRQSFLSSLL